MARRGSTALLIMCVTCGSARSVRADAPRELEWSSEAVALRLSVLGAGLLVASFGTQPPQACRVCVIPDVDLSAAELIGSDDDPELYARVSDGLVYGSIALGASASLLAEGDAELWGQDLAIISESLLATGLTVSIVKRLSARVRPAIYLSRTNADVDDEEAYQSFFSGHSAMIAALSASVTTIAYLREYAYRGAALAAGIGLTLSVGVLRMAGQRHWLTDVITGWVIGAAFGVFVPLLLHEREPEPRAAANRAAAARALPLIAIGF